MNSVEKYQYVKEKTHIFLQLVAQCNTCTESPLLNFCAAQSSMTLYHGVEIPSLSFDSTVKLCLYMFLFVILKKRKLYYKFEKAH